MFGSDLLDIAIGMIFVYLLLSLICSAANEIIEAWLKNRATDLERGIRELLSPNAGVSNEGTVAKLYNHPLINGLHRGFYKDYVAYYNHNKFVRWLIRTFTTNPKLPSYIPARNFALALMDTVLPATSAHTPAAQTDAAANGDAADADAAGAAAPDVPGPAGALLEADAQAADRRSGATGATPPSARAAAAALAVAEAAEGISLQPLRDAIGAIPNKQTRDALLTLVDAAVNDPAKARENIEAWFNSSMDRVSGWYKQRTQFIIFVLGFAIAVALNADSVTLVKSLSTDKTLRDSLVVAAEAYAKANPSPTPATTTGAGPQTQPADATTKPSPTVAPQATPSVSPTATPLTSPPAPAAGTTGTTSDNTGTNGTTTGTTTAGTTGATTAAPQTSPTPPLPPECVKDANSPECKLAKNREAIKNLGLPIGWLDAGDDARRIWPGNKWRQTGGWLDQIYWHFFGWLITALAVSLGAPFWFDLLNKFIVVRSTVKPHEKSREEGSKE